MFQDITTLLLDHKAFKDTVDIFVDRYRNMGISVVAGDYTFAFFFLLGKIDFGELPPSEKREFVVPMHISMF